MIHVLIDMSGIWLPALEYMNNAALMCFALQL